MGEVIIGLLQLYVCMRSGPRIKRSYIKILYFVFVYQWLIRLVELWHRFDSRLGAVFSVRDARWSILIRLPMLGSNDPVVSSSPILLPRCGGLRDCDA